MTNDPSPLELLERVRREEGRVLYAAAPMVRYSKLAFRETVARVGGVDLVWTPMILAKEFNRSALARDSDFTLAPSPTPTIVQLGVNSPQEMHRSTLLLAPHVNGIDINCGCPQSWACAETLGAALMHQPALVSALVRSAKSALASLGLQGRKTVSVKIRVHAAIHETRAFVRAVEDAGVDFITVHGRTRSTPSSKPVDLDAIRAVKAAARVPVLANGDVFTLADVRRVVEATGVDGVMSARGLLEDPGLFAHHHHHHHPHHPEPAAPAAPAEPAAAEERRRRWKVLEHFVIQVIRAPIPFKLVVHHLSEMGSSDRERKGSLFSKEEKARLMECKTMLELLDWLDELGDGREIRR
ncbi:dihydrouridine synthase [Drepanopeziza brunnea f. sp. 'multigermtubi' MB_m1]|uniref:tRNA-dihydrouridine synthase n=1 Tax=Marssonina brunnea f. sp. multigermtubi (strain MB_m1) TaxID=1072389 RepID=K1WUL5_MARBU|nr:dihydrouridine synthase [Drepanopeziza brunnea f. sp. 'multigermtubi' MB_m1]EKD12313.1 dihydrouridine synthase [Drepanopeziza brunnea f. sp. 'multigermtubi' MB_m1]